MVILEKIMNKAGFVRFCDEHWHYEYSVTERYNKSDKQSRCWEYYGTLDKPIPQTTKDKANEITNEQVGAPIF